MSQYFALTWNAKPGTEQIVEDLFRNSGRPQHIIIGPDGKVIGKLLSTQVFMKGNTVVRVIEVEGDLPEVAKHMGRQQEVKDLEREFDKYLETPRDMSTPEGAQKFFMEASMRCILSRKADD